jgi:hypothetical protein
MVLVSFEAQSFDSLIYKIKKGKKRKKKKRCREAATASSYLA